MKTPLLLLVFAFLAAGSSLTAQDNQASAILQKEEVRRQEILLRANMELAQAEDMIRTGEFDKARGVITGLMQRVPNSGQGEAVHARARRILSALELQRAGEAVETEQWLVAREAAQKALEYDSNNRQALRVLERTNKALGADSKGNLNPAVDEAFMGKLERVRDLMARAQDRIETGQYDEAEKDLQIVLNIDPYNKAAAAMQKELMQHEMRYAQVARQSGNQERETFVREGWSERTSVEASEATTGAPVEPITRSNDFRITEKLKNIVIPEINFNDASIQDAAGFLTATTRELDTADGTGVSFLIQDAAQMRDTKRFSLKLKNVPAGEALRYATNLSGTKFKIQDFAVFIVPLTAVTQTLVTREFPVQPSFFDDVGTAPEDTTTSTRRIRSPTTTATTGPSGAESAKKVLESLGVIFSEGATALYNPATGILTVKNTQDQIDLIEELVASKTGETLLVRIETKFVEINQSDLDSLTPNWRLAGAYPLLSVPGLDDFGIQNGSQIAFGSASASTNFSGPNGLLESDATNRFLQSLSAADEVTNPTGRNLSQNQLGITGSIDENQFAMLLEGLSQKDSYDLMTAPSIVVNDGAQGIITVAREFYYPTEFDQPQVDIGEANGIRTTVSPAFPTEFEKRNVGVVLTVRPKVTVDRKRVYLTLKPEVTEFDGFINYGPAVFTPAEDPDDPPLFVNQNVVNQPVFSVRTVENAQLEILDGYTMVLGGLIREDVSTVDEKVPLLGDIPLLGRAFRSKAEQAVKRNLLIFVSVRILRPDGQPVNMDMAKAPAAVPAS